MFDSRAQRYVETLLEEKRITRFGGILIMGTATRCNGLSLPRVVGDEVIGDAGGGCVLPKLTSKI
jgi:hypothetical protein